MNTAKDRTVVLTGASGTLGRFLALALATRYKRLVLTDIHDFPGSLPEGTRFIKADISNAADLSSVCEGADTIIHFGGVNTEKTFEPILPANIVGTVSVFEAARLNDARVVSASSNHVIGFYESGRRLTIADPVRPDGFYGVSKVFGETIGRLYFDKFGIESVHLRIGSCLEEPTSIRHLSTWLSYPDLLRMVIAAVEAEQSDFAVVWGISANTRAWWTEDDSTRIGFRAEDDAEAFAEKILQGGSATERFQGGPFCTYNPYDPRG